MKQNESRTGVYILFLLLGMGVGMLGGGEIMRRIYLPQKFLSVVTDAQNNSPGFGAAKNSAAPDGTGFNNLQLSRNNAIVYATRKVAPCVVGIVVTQIQVVGGAYNSDDFFDFFFGPELTPQYRQIESIGSGFIIRSDGMILTNYHVVKNAAKLYVNFSDGRRIEGNVVGFDDRSDLAVVSVKGQDFRSVSLGKSDEAMIGEWAIAIGNPFLNFINDAHPTVTLGVVSALNRNFAPSQGVYYQGMIQTDAAINPGNSGGPLVNALGEVIGINTFIYTGSNNNKGSIGIGFAIPIERAQKVAQEIITYGKRRQVWTGISVQDLNRSISLSLGYSGIDGVAIISLQPGSPGEKAGLHTGDVITRMGNRIIQSHTDIEGFFLDYFVNDRVNMSIVRKGRAIDVKLTLSEFPGK